MAGGAIILLLLSHMEDNTIPPTMEVIKMLEERWGHLQLSKEEQRGIIVREEASEEENIKE